MERWKIEALKTMAILMPLGFGGGIYANFLFEPFRGPICYTTDVGSEREDIDSNYINPKNISIFKIDQNRDHYKKVVLEYITKDGLKKIVFLKESTLEKLSENQ